MVFVTGDCHAKFNKFSVENFPEQKEMSIRQSYCCTLWVILVIHGEVCPKLS